ncbi:MAG: response regulator [Bacteroidetes bacterium]|nr:response regulator [Bacteroidota bacterium]
MELKVLIVDDIKDNAETIEEYVLDYQFVISKWTQEAIELDITVISGTDAFDKAQKYLQEDIDFHIIMIDEELHGDSGYGLFTMIDNEKYNIYKVLFSQNYEHYKKPDNTIFQLEFAGAKYKENIFLTLLKYERDVLMEKCFGIKALCDSFYENPKVNEKQNHNPIYELEDTITSLYDTLRFKTLEEYHQELRNISIWPIMFKENILSSTPILDQEGSSTMNKVSIDKLNGKNFYYIKKGSESDDSNDAEEIAICELGILRIESVRRALKSFKEDDKPYITDRSFVYNPLWVFPLKDNIQKMEIITHSNQRKFIDLPQNSKLVNGFDAIKKLFPKFLR